MSFSNGRLAFINAKFSDKLASDFRLVTASSDTCTSVMGSPIKNLSWLKIF